jgi:capsular exopolysaccharide synthesis family protein
MGKTVNSVKQDLDVKRILKKYASNWYIFVIALILAFVFAQNKNKYIVPLYSLKTTVLIEDKSNTSMLQERGVVSSSPTFLNTKLIDNQIALLKSFAQIKRIVENLDFMVSYFEAGEYIDLEIYKDSPFVVGFDDNHPQVRYKKIYIKFLSDFEYEVVSPESTKLKVPQRHMIGDTVKTASFCFWVNWKPDIVVSDFLQKRYIFVINDLNGLVGQYMGKTGVYVERGTSMLVVTSKGSNKKKEIDFLNQLTTEFLLVNLEKKNQILTNTIAFINQQLLEVGTELEATEKRLEDFRQLHQFMFIEEKIGALLKNLDSESKDAKNLRIDLQYYRYLFDYVKNRDDIEQVVMPSSMGVNLPMFNALAGKLSQRILERDALLSNSTRDNPYIQIIESDILNMKENLVESMRSTIETTEQKLDETETRMFKLNEEFSGLPAIEREYLSIERDFKIINNLYDFLLKRKSDVEIQRAANSPDHEVVDHAGEAGISNVSENPKSAYINAIIWAILIPSVFLFLIVFFNNRVMALEDITSNTDYPVAGSVSTNPSKHFDAVLKSPSSYYTELFRLIRIKINLQTAKGEQVLMVTSSVVEEGKTFIALNLASVYALTGKKTLLVGFDMRRSDIGSELELDENLGITPCLLHQLSIEQVVQKTPTKNLDILLSGPVPPNPDELIESPKAQLMFQELRKKYDYIVMDTPPIGLFGDAILLNKYCDATVFVVRHNFTRKKEMVSSLNEVESNNLKNVFILYNDAKITIKDRNIIVYGEQAPKRFFIVRWALSIRRIIIDTLRKL